MTKIFAIALIVFLLILAVWLTTEFERSSVYEALTKRAEIDLSVLVNVIDSKKCINRNIKFRKFAKDEGLSAIFRRIEKGEIKFNISNADILTFVSNGNDEKLGSSDDIILTKEINNVCEE